MKITDDVRGGLLEILGPDSLLEGEDDLARYGRDETPGLEHLPDLVVLPRDAAQVGDLLRFATERLFYAGSGGGKRRGPL